MSAQPKGVIAIWTDPQGSVMATHADFDRSGYGGCKLWEAQRMRARDIVKREAISRYCSPVVSECLSNYLFTQISEEMLKAGHRISVRAIGYEGKEKEEIER